MKKAVLFIAGVLLFVVGLWLIAIPAGLIQGLIEDSRGRSDLYLKAEGLEKGLFYSIHIEKVLLKRKGFEDPLMVFDDVHAGIDVASLLRLSPAIEFGCLLNRGRVLGDIKLTNRNYLRVRVDGISIDGIPFFELIGIRGKGSLSGDFRLKDKAGEMRFSVNGMKLRSTVFPPKDLGKFLGVSLSGSVPVPLDLFDGIKGEISINNGITDVKSFSMEGSGVYARVKGDIREGKMNMKMEVMTDSSFKSEYLLEMMLRQYRVSPGYYLIPLRI